MGMVVVVDVDFVGSVDFVVDAGAGVGEVVEVVAAVVDLVDLLDSD